MTIMEAISTIDSLKPNGFQMEEKVKWLSEIDGIIKKNIVDKHEGGENINYSGYDMNTNLSETKLIAEAPYDVLYVHWLESKIDYYNGEYRRYNNSSVAFNEAYNAYARFYNRTNMPIQAGKFKY